MKPARDPVHVVSVVQNLGATGGGAERMARELAARIDRRRFRSTLCLTRVYEDKQTADQTVLVRELEEQGVRVLRLGRRDKFDMNSWLPLIRCLRAEKVAVLHGHMYGSNVWVSTLGPLAGVPVTVAHEHGWSYEGQPLRRFLDRQLISRRCDAIIASSELARTRMIQVERIDPDRTRLAYIHNGIAEPVCTGRSVRAELALRSDAPTVVAVARLHYYKALHVLIDATSRLVSEFRHLRVLIVGEGPERAALEAQIARLRLGSVITLLGSRGDVPDVVAACDVGTLCSYSETTPLAIMEYMALAKPVVATRVGGIPDLVQDGVDGLLVEPHDPGGLASALATVLRTPDRGAAMGARARVHQQREFSIDAVTRQVEALYEELLAEKLAFGTGRRAERK